MMLPGRLMPVIFTSNSPRAMQPKRMVHCLTMLKVLIDCYKVTRKWREWWKKLKEMDIKNPLVLRICELRCNIAAQVEKEKAKIEWRRRDIHCRYS